MPENAPPETSGALPLLQARGITMAFGGVDVLKAVDLDLCAGEVHALIGENGAGKSTLARIIGGIYRPRAGTLRLDGQPVQLANPHAALERGIALIHQEPLTFPDLSVAENIFIGHPPRTRLLRRIDRRATRRRAAAILSDLHVSLDPDARVRGLRIAAQQMVELASALSREVRILLLDEPTAALTPAEVADLFRIMRRLRERGVALVFVSHRLEEVFEIADRITVLRDGERVGHCRTAETNVNEVIRWMVGRAWDAAFERPPLTPGRTLLEVRNLSRRGEFENVSFMVRAGEIVGMAGLVGSGRSEVARTLWGIRAAERGEILIDGRPAALRHPRDAMRHGLAYVPEDRQRQGLLMPLTIARNLSLPNLRDMSHAGWVREKQERRIARAGMAELRVVARSPRQPARELSGGNQQKIVLAKWLRTRPKVMLLDEPTRGIDIGAKREVYRLIARLAAEGMGILMISSELPEILALSDRILVMHEGLLAAEFPRTAATAETIMAAATGQRGSTA